MLDMRQKLLNRPTSFHALFVRVEKIERALVRLEAVTDKNNLTVGAMSLNEWASPLEPCFCHSDICLRICFLRWPPPNQDRDHLN